MKTFQVDTQAELTSIVGAEMGDIAYVVNEAAKYMVNSQGEWINQTGIPAQGLATEEYVDNAVAEVMANPLFKTFGSTDIPGAGHLFGIYLDPSENKTLVEKMMETGLGMYNFWVGKGAPGQPEAVVAKNSSCRGLCCYDTANGTGGKYGWIIMIDQDGDTYIQYIRNGVAQGWKQVAFV